MKTKRPQLTTNLVRLVRMTNNHESNKILVDLGGHTLTVRKKIRKVKADKQANIIFYVIWKLEAKASPSKEVKLRKHQTFGDQAWFQTSNDRHRSGWVWTLKVLPKGCEDREEATLKQVAGSPDEKPPPLQELPLKTPKLSLDSTTAR